ncbi:hypothetical protein ES705_15427 [subsurface metagenome]
MSENQKDQSPEKYLKDIETIKDLLADVDKRPLYEPWIFYVWGGLVAIGTLIHYLVERSLNLPIGEIFLKIWLPVILTMAFFEFLAFIRNLARHSIPFFSRGIAKLYISMIGSGAALVFIVLLFMKLDAIEYLPIVILLAGAIIYFILAQRSAYVYLIAHGILMVLLAILFYLFNIEHHTLSLIVGCVFAFSLIIAGFNAGRMAKKGK